jgi:uncharacterized protein (TIGR03067 family)
LSESIRRASGQEVINSLQGEWNHVYQEINGQMPSVDQFSTTVLEIQGHKFIIKKGGNVAYEGKFSVNVNVTPNEISLIYSKGPEIFLGAPRNGIFQLVRNTLKINVAAIGQRPPTDFNTSQESESVLAILERAGADLADVSTESATRSVAVW